MENRKAIIISAVCFLVSILLISSYVKVRENEMTKQFGERVEVVIVSTQDEKPIPEYSVIRRDQVKVIEVFKKFKQPSTVSDPVDVIGKSAYVPISNGEQITLTKLVMHEGKPVLDRQVEKNMRAITLTISPQSGVGRLIRPGDRVDIISAPHYDMGGTTIFEVTTVLQNILVLATGKNIQNAVPTRVKTEVMDYLEEEFAQHQRKDWGGGSRERLPTSRPVDDYTTLTLEVTPEQAKKILFLTHTYGSNRLTFTLRNSADQTIAKLDTTLLDDVLGPDSDYGRSFRKPPRINPPKPRFYDSKGGKAIPIY